MKTLVVLLAFATICTAQTKAQVQADIASAQIALTQALNDLASIQPPTCPPPPPPSGGTINWFPLAPPDFSTGWTWVNQNMVSFSTSSLGFAVLTVPYQSTAQFNNLVQSLPSAPYTLTITFAMTTPLPGSYVTGLTLQGGGKAVNFMVNLYQVPGSIVVTHESAAGVIGTETVVFQNNNLPDGQIRSLRIHDDGTTRSFFYSADGGTAFAPVYSEPSATFLTASTWGVVVFNRANSGVTTYSTIYNLSEANQ